jgi:hypothetical protein
MKKIILLFIIALSGILLFASPVFAANSELLVVPAVDTKNITESFNVLVNINPQQNKICVVRGTINFDKLSCQTITTASGIFSAVNPTCENPNFILGIPGCTTELKNILTISVKGSQIGTANVFFTNVNFWGAGTVVPFLANSGTYNIFENIIPVKTTEEILIPEEEPVVVAESENVVEENPVVNQEVSENNNNQNPWAAGLLSVAEKYIWQILIVFLVAIAGYAIYYFVSKKRK